LEELLISQEWVVVKPERLSLMEQYNLFRNAKVVMGPHGGGLANTAFMPEQSTVVELRTLIPGVFHGDKISQCYKNLSQVLGNNHISLDLSVGEYKNHEIPPTILTLLKELDIQ
jgi:capsular polysaccharide biosynthesis protein